MTKNPSLLRRGGSMSLLAAPAALWFALDVRPDVAHGDKEKNSGLTLVLLAMGWVAFGVVFG